MDRTAGWVFASVAVVAATVLRMTALAEEHSTAFLIGGVLGAIVGGVLIGLLLRFAYVKLIRKGAPVWSPWVLVIAAVVSLAVAASRVGESIGGEEATAGASAEGGCDAAARTAKELTASLPRPWRDAPADEAVVDQVTSSMPDSAERVTARAIVRGGEPVAALLVMEMTERDGSQEDFLSGFESQAQGSVEDARLGSAEARLYRAPDGGGTLAGFSDPCAATIIFGTSPELVRELAGDLPVEG